MKHYFHYIQEVVAKNWDAPALSDFEGTISYTYGELTTQICKLKILFEQLGIEHHDKIAICGKNSSNWGISFLSTIAYKAVAVSILPDFTEESIQYLIEHSESKVLFVCPWVLHRIDITKLRHLEAIINIEDFVLIYCKNSIEQSVLNDRFNRLYPNFDESILSNLSSIFPTDNMDELALINYTSGSTGSPKGVMVTHKNLASNVIFGQDNIPNHPGLTLVSMLPLAHMFGMMFEFLYQMAGGTHVYFITKNLTPSILMKAFGAVHPYMILTVPLVVEKIFKKKIFPIINKPLIKMLWYTPGINQLIRRKVYNQLMESFGGKLKFLIIGGAALNEEVERCMKQIHFPYTCGYGMTECAPLLCYAKWNEFEFKSCGRIIDRMEIRVDSNDPTSTPGEIQVRGANVMLGYYKNPEATNSAFTKDGWLRTGDIGIIDQKNNVFLRGRCKNMILGPSGQNIYPEEIEDKLNSLDGIVECVVVERKGLLVGLVYPEDLTNREEFAKATLDKVNKLLPAYARLGSIEIVEKEFEKTPKKSIKRFLYS